MEAVGGGARLFHLLASSLVALTLRSMYLEM